MKTPKSTNHENGNDANNVLAAVGLTKEEESELQLLRLLQADNRRWLSMWEFNRIAELSRKAFEGRVRPLPLTFCGFVSVILPCRYLKP
jgi:hypothetical protein